VVVSLGKSWGCEVKRKTGKRAWCIDEKNEAIGYVRDNFDTIVVSYSGGKDSTAALVWCRDAFPDKLVVGVLADTGIEPPGLREYVARIEQIVGVKITWCDEAVHLRDGCVVKDVFDVARRDGRFPFPGRCNWQTLLKAERIRRWLRRQEFSRPVLVMGQRRGESRRRSKMPYFSGGEGWRNGAEIFRPVLEWSEDDVYGYVAEKGFPLHPAYGLGFKRISCMPCVMAPIPALELLAEIYPERLERMAELEDELGSQFHPRYSIRRFMRTRSGRV